MALDRSHVVARIVPLEIRGVGTATSFDPPRTSLRFVYAGDFDRAAAAFLAVIPTLDRPDRERVQDLLAPSFSTILLRIEGQP